MPFVPRNYDEWKHCITQKCSISLTKKYVQERIIALSNVNNNQTKKFIETWGPSHHERTLGWFQKAAQEIRHKQLKSKNLQTVPQREMN